MHISFANISSKKKPIEQGRKLTKAYFACKSIVKIDTLKESVNYLIPFNLLCQDLLYLTSILAYDHNSLWSEDIYKLDWHISFYS